MKTMMNYIYNSWMALNYVNINYQNIRFTILEKNKTLAEDLILNKNSINLFFNLKNEDPEIVRLCKYILNIPIKPLN
jgi:hypothetical protein